MNARRLLLAVLACLPALTFAQVTANNGKKAFPEVMATRATLDQLRAGGYVLYIRHGNTDNRRADRFPNVDLNDCETQRILNDDGRKLMREIGKQLREAKIPVGEILVSPMWRTRESATWMFGDRFPNVDLNDCETQRILNDDGRKLMREIGKQLREARIPVGEILASPMCRTRESATLMFGERFAVSEPLMYSANMTSEEKKPRLAALARILRDPVAAGSNRVLVAHAPNLADLIGFFVKPEGTVVIFAQRGDAGYEYVASIPPGLWPQLLR